MKILFLTSRFPYPLEKGDKLRAYYQIKELASRHHIHLISITDTDIQKKDLEKLAEITTSIQVIRLSPIERYWSLFRSIFNGVPFQIAWFYSNQIQKSIQKMADAIVPDHVFCQLPRMAEYASILPYPKTLDYMDSFGVGMKKRASIATGLTSWLYHVEARRMIKYEANISEKFDHLTIISEQDKEQFNFPRAAGIKVINNGISSDFFDYKKTREKKFDILFVGNMSYLPNIESVEYLMQHIIPLLPPDIKVLIAGANPAERVKVLSSDNVTVTGWMDDIRDAYATSKIFVAPMWSGTGQQNKILEAMAMGIPCITTSVVNNAIGAKENQEILLAETPQSFEKAIQKLLTDKELYSRLSENSKHMVKQKFSWTDSGKLLDDLIRQ